MDVPRTLLAAGLAAASLAAPAAAAPSAGQDLVYTVTARHKDGGLVGTCAFRPDRWTADHGPTYVDAVAYGAGVQSTSITCRIYSHGTLAGQADAVTNGPVATIQGERLGPVAYRPYVTVCVTAATTYVADHGQSVESCVTP